MATGTVKKIAQERGFGFIKAASGPDVFFHHSVVADRQFDNLVVGQVVDYEADAASQAKGPRAKSVVICQSTRVAA
jgi:CspA family cold shock protein